MSKHIMTPAQKQAPAPGDILCPDGSYCIPSGLNGASPTQTAVSTPSLAADPHSFDYEGLLDGNVKSDIQLRAELIASAMGRPNDKIFWTSDELLDAHFPEPTWIVPNLVPSGLTILGGRPKIGKSFLALQIAVAVASGGMVFGEGVQRRKVLYLALEDYARRLQERLAKEKAPRGMDLEFATWWPSVLTPIGEIDSLDLLLDKIEREHIELTVIDTYARVFLARKPNDEVLLAERLGALQRFHVDNDKGALLVAHHSKASAYSGSQNQIDDLMGPTSIAATADAALGLYRVRGQPTEVLKLTGRDVAERELAVRFDPEIFCWQLLGEAAGVKAHSLQAEILEAMTETYGGESTCTEAARFLNKDRGNVYREIQELIAKGKLIKQPKEGKEVIYRVKKQSQQ